MTPSPGHGATHGHRARVVPMAWIDAWGACGAIGEPDKFGGELSPSRPGATMSPSRKSLNTVRAATLPAARPMVARARGDSRRGGFVNPWPERLTEQVVADVLVDHPLTADAEQRHRGHPAEGQRHLGSTESAGFHTAGRGFVGRVCVGERPLRL